MRTSTNSKILWAAQIVAAMMTNLDPEEDIRNYEVRSKDSQSS